MKNNLFTIDSSVFISSFKPEEKNSFYSFEFLRKIIMDEKNTGIATPTIVFLETIHTIRKLDNRRNMQTKVVNLLKKPIFTWLSLDANFIEKYLKTNIKNLKTSDAIIAVTSQYLQSQLITWDIKLKQAVKGALTPKEWLNNNKPKQASKSSSTPKSALKN